MQSTSDIKSDGNTESAAKSSRDKGEWRDKCSFWIFGLTYKFGNILILTAAHDINHNLPELNLTAPPRHCFEMSSGLILVANVVPAHLLLFIMPKIQLSFAILMTTACIINIVSFVIIALADIFLTALIGVVVNSVGFGIAEYVLSTESRQYKSTILNKFMSASDWSCVCSSFYYAILRELKVNMAWIFYSLIPLPCFTILITWFLLRPPVLLASAASNIEEDSEFHLSIFQLQPPLVVFEDKCEYIGHLMQYVMPLGIITIMQFFINQGLYEFVYFRQSFVSVDSQYRWLNFIYQIGFCACMTTKTLLVLHHIWIYTLLQFLVLLYFILDAIFFFMDYLWVTMLLAYFEGIISGAAYINTIHKMEEQELESRMDIAEEVMKQSLSLKTILGGTLAILVHHFLCKTAEPRLR